MKEWLDLKTEMKGAHFTSGGNWFHNRGAVTTKAQSPFCLRRVQGTYKRALSVDLRDG